ncbi:MAG: ketoacyl-ACP synthase III [Deltaproteobacteria bacterium]|nr:ketoacyl-ACP synthase III [Deltaproteobacteria bacterium]MBW1718587.1 ketoacyl-ACP synthase III [Deltaproteobacteria bacterium]MBW1931735.1 ketoacyl-ACP synthase III [Deltaproteobacteria bacterium]MBW1937939.1 ketoacyl-ACP synthase III [Deltaproteobacteria bacterium]MBW1964671.1 ketoacyl-ACP synthase III [Deltaproteobacteria bacterium]
MRSIIIGTGSYVPQRVVTNKDLESLVDTTDEWIRTRTGILQRHISNDQETNSYLATQSARKALDMAGVRPQDLDFIIVGTMTPDMPMPSVACLVQNELGAKKAGAFDLYAACTSFLYALSVADKFIRVNPSMKILVIGSEVLSRVTNWEDRNTCVLFGDGAGAAVITGTREDRGILSTHLHADGSLGELLILKGLGTAFPVSHENLEKGWQYIQMQGKEVFKHAVKAMESAAWEAIEANGWNGDDVDLLFSHQANIRIINFLGERLGIPKEKIFINIHKYGNTSAASIPIGLDEANRTGLLTPGLRILMVAFGGGFTWGSVAMCW